MPLSGLDFSQKLMPKFYVENTDDPTKPYILWGKVGHPLTEEELEELYETLSEVLYPDTKELK